VDTTHCARPGSQPDERLPAAEPGDPAAASGGADALLAALNPEQREAVLRTDGPLLILAGAGSGKTRVIACRIAHVIASGLAAPDRVLAVTFTNKAAEEMRSRVGGLVAVDPKLLWISTFHAICARLLRREAPALGLSRDFVIYDTADQQAAIKQILKDLGIDDKRLSPRTALARISHARNRMEGAASLRSGWGPLDDVLPKVFERYVSLLRASNALDFDDLLLRTVELFQTAEHVRLRYAAKFRYIMVDEYQDTNRPQYLLIRQLADGHRNLAVVGDPDQSIYKWRGADLKNILDFEVDFPEAAIVRLERNYRSTQVILDAASAVIRRNRHRKEKRLWTERQGGRSLVFFCGSDELEEAGFICRTTRRVLAESSSNTVAVLYRMNAQSRVIEDALMRDGVPYRIVGSVRFYERKEVKDALAYLKLLVNPHDDVSFRRVVNVPARGIGRGVLDALEAADLSPSGEVPPLVAAGLAPTAPAGSLWSRMTHTLETRRLPSRARAALQGFHDLVVTLAATARREPVGATLESVLDRSGYLRSLREERSEEAQDRLQNLEELVSAAREFEAREIDPSLGGFIDRLSLLSETDEERGANAARVWLMTLHAAKGLEFPVVVMAGMEDGLFPHARSREDEADIEEERRLCYVGMTRAQDQLLLSCAARRRVFGEYQPTQVSRFVDELPPELVERHDARVWAPSSTARFGTEMGAGRQGLHGPRRPWTRQPPPSGGDTHEAQATPWRHEDEDQSRSRLGPGRMVRHPQFGLGMVLSVEGDEEDVKVVVRFNTVGRKKLVARFARLEPA
jgi:DNA helicase-2/ATP-dependent DNA helicase PcrA